MPRSQKTLYQPGYIVATLAEAVLKIKDHKFKYRICQRCNYGILVTIHVQKNVEIGVRCQNCGDYGYLR